jgi:hypothetical protein
MTRTICAPLIVTVIADVVQGIGQRERRESGGLSLSRVGSGNKGVYPMLLVHVGTMIGVLLIALRVFGVV